MKKLRSWKKTNTAGVGRYGIQKILLRTVAHAGMLSVALLAPKALSAIVKLTGIENTLGFSQRIEKSIATLVRSGEMKWIQTARGKVLQLTDKGENKLAKLLLSDVAQKRRRWDQRWRIVMYDIHESKRKKRQFLRNTLREIGFYRLQDSVWVYPHKCDELVVLLRTHFSLGHEVQYLEVDHIENDTVLIRHFHKLIL